MACNEPTLACYRIQEHVHKTVPVLQNKLAEIAEHEGVLKGLFYDLEYSTATVKQVAETSDRFDKINQSIQNAFYQIPPPKQRH